MSQVAAGHDPAAKVDFKLAVFYHFAGITDDEKENLVTNYGIKSFDILEGKIDNLKGARYRNVGRARQLYLYKCVLWYQDYQRFYEKIPNLSKAFNEDALLEFEINGFRIPYPKGESLRHVFEVLRCSDNGLQNRLAEFGIKTFDCVLKRKKALKDGEVRNVPKKIQKELAQAADWFDDYCKEHHNRPPNFLQEFTEESFDAFIEKNHYRYNLNVEEYYKLTKMAVKEDKKPDFLKAFDAEQLPVIYDQIIEFGVKEVKEKYMPPALHQSSPSDLDRFLKYWVTNLINFESEDTYQEPYVRTKSTQAGKTAEKAIVGAACRSLGVLSIVVTKGDRESKELLQKLKNFASEEHQDFVVGKAALRKRKNGRCLELRRALENAGMVSVADTKAQMEKVNGVLKEYLQGGENNSRFVAIVDEGRFLLDLPVSLLGGIFISHHIFHHCLCSRRHVPYVRQISTVRKAIRTVYE